MTKPCNSIASNPKYKSDFAIKIYDKEVGLTSKMDVDKIEKNEPHYTLDRIVQLYKESHTIIQNIAEFSALISVGTTNTQISYYRNEAQVFPQP